MTTPTTAGGAVLPITDWRDGAEYWSAVDDDATKGAIALTLHAPAQAEIDALRADLQAMTDDRDSWCAQASARTEDAVRFAAERDALKAAQDDQARDAGRLANDAKALALKLRTPTITHHQVSEDHEPYETVQRERGPGHEAIYTADLLDALAAIAATKETP